MNMYKFGALTAVFASMSAPAWADVGGGIDLISSYDYLPLGARIVDVPVIQPSVSIGLFDFVEVTGFASSTIEGLNEPWKNAGSELDATAAAKLGSIGFEAGYFWYPNDVGDAFYRASVDLPLGFTASVQRLAGVSNATSFGIQTPAYEVGAVSFAAAAYHTETANDEFNVVSGTMTLSLTDHVNLQGQVFRTSGFEPFPGLTEDETRASVKLALAF